MWCAGTLWFAVRVRACAQFLQHPNRNESREWDISYIKSVPLDTRGRGQRPRPLRVWVPLPLTVRQEAHIVSRQAYPFAGLSMGWGKSQKKTYIWIYKIDIHFVVDILAFRRRRGVQSNRSQ